MLHANGTQRQAARLFQAWLILAGEHCPIFFMTSLCHTRAALSAQESDGVPLPGLLDVGGGHIQAVVRRQLVRVAPEVLVAHAPPLARVLLARVDVQAAPGSSSVQALVLPLKILSYALTCFTKGCARTLLYLARALRVQGACLFAHGTAAHWPCMVRTGV